MEINRKLKLSLLGVPLDFNSSYLRGAAEGPAAVRKALRCASSNNSSEDGRDIVQLMQDAGDVQADEVSWMDAIRQSVSNLLQAGALPLVIGGDHSITYPVVSAVAAHYPNLTILHFDAHPDLYDEFEGNRFSHACPFARIMEERHARRLVQVGIRTMNAYLLAQVHRFGVEVIEMKDWRGVLPHLDPPLYVSFDLDVLDPGFAPGISHYEPGGMSTREAIAAIQSISADIVAADVVELNPRRDINGLTAMVAARIVKELASKILPSAA
ncbi:MAG: agmatinase [Acidobacteriota bacterium]|nr:agmatinase [Acidobacteriota bacterium]